MAQTKPRQRKNCVKGFSCGFTCISTKKTCSEKVQERAAKALNELVRTIQKSKKPKKQGKSEIEKKIEKLTNIGERADHENLIELGELATKKYQPMEMGEKEKKLMNKAYSDNVTQEDIDKYLSVSSIEAKKREDSNEKQYKTLLDEIRKLNQYPNDISLVNLDETLGSTTNNVRDTLKDVGSLMSPRSLETLDDIIADEERASASKDQAYIDIGFETKKKEEIRRVLFHESGHHMEFGDTALQQAAENFRTSKTSSKTPETLNSIMRTDVFDDDEVAYRGDYIHPYVGKVYKNGYTEVISMGFEQFNNAQSLANFAKKYPDHFHFTVGALLSRKS